MNQEGRKAYEVLAFLLESVSCHVDELNAPNRSGDGATKLEAPALPLSGTESWLNMRQCLSYSRRQAVFAHIQSCDQWYFM